MKQSAVKKGTLYRKPKSEPTEECLCKTPQSARFFLFAELFLDVID